jgi:endonuclease III
VVKKSDLVSKLLQKIEPRRALPKPMAEANLLEQGMLAVLVRHMPQEKAEAALATLRKAYPDWNEMRVAQGQEIAAHLLSKARRGNHEALREALPAAREARDYLQEVFQKTHGLDLEFLREDMAASGKLVQQMPLLGLAAGSYILWLAGDKQMPVHGALIRVLDRLGLISRTASMKKARDLIDPLVPQGDELAFVTAFGEVADRWCDARKPLCQVCVLVEDCPFGKKTFQEWKQQQVRLEAQRAKEDARRVLFEKKELARKQREEARAAKIAAAEFAKKERERLRREAIENKKRAQLAAQQARIAAQQKKVVAKAAAAEKAAQEKARKAAAKRGTLAPSARKDRRSGGRERARKSRPLAVSKRSSKVGKSTKRRSR